MTSNKKRITRTERAKKAIQGLLNAFQKGTAFRWIGCHIVKTGRPSDAWSLANYLIMAISGTEDARGIKQWRDAGRRVKKGAKAVWILAPRNIVRKEEDEDTGELKEKKFLAGFLGVPVFRYEDTEGEPLKPVKAKYPDLKKVADAWGIKVEYAPVPGGALGLYSTGKVIKLKSDDAEVFFHELAHAAQDRLGMLENGARCEIAAEACALGLCAVYGGQTSNSMNNFGAYIQDYSKKMNMKPEMALMSVLKDCEAILDCIIREAGEEMIK
ncbi:M48 family peptidase [Candidatus Woesearchaeota archaeon]|nr:M48 family peptidase [Candidatus Woesearchaeota archaeon]